MRGASPPFVSVAAFALAQSPSCRRAPISPGDTCSSASTGSDHGRHVDGQPLRILHAARAPVGGIFRHILDLANGQADRGHHVGIIADSLTGGERAEQALAEIAPRLKLGVHRIAIRREPLPLDFLVWAAVHAPDPPRSSRTSCTATAPRPALSSACSGASKDTIRVYTPHGGSLHYPLLDAQGRSSTAASSAR